MIDDDATPQVSAGTGNGGQGGPLSSLAPGPGQTSDTRLVERAIRERWPITSKVRRLVVRRLAKVVASPASSAREVASAAKGLLAADALNVAASKADAPSVAVQVNAPVAQVRIVELPANGRDAIPLVRPAPEDDDDSFPCVEGTNGHANGHTNGNGHAHH